MVKEKKIHLPKAIRLGYTFVIENEDWRGKRVQNICRALLMYDDNKDINEIIETLKISRRSFFNYKKKFRTDPYFMLRGTRRSHISILEVFENKIADDFKQTHIKTYKQAQKRIEEILDIKRSETQIRHFLINAGFKKNKNGNYNRRPLKPVKILKIEHSCLYQKRDEVEKYIDELMPNNPKIMVQKLKERYPELKVFNDDDIIEHTASISSF